MPTDYRRQLKDIRDFRSLIPFLRDEMNWPISQDALEDVDDLFFDYTAEELGVEAKVAAKIKSIKQLRPLHASQPWGVFFVTFEPKRLPVVALRRILSQVAVRKRASANAAERAAWKAGDLLFVSSYGEGEERQISFAHFTVPDDGRDLPTLKVLGWDNRDTPLHLDAAASDLTGKLCWPADESDHDQWRRQWRSAFSLRHGETVTTSKELSIRLAELARAIRDRIKTALAIETDKGELTKLMKAFQEALVHDLDADGFADMYAQTIAYGLLSARIADPHRKTADDFAAHMRTNPFLRELMETFLKVSGRRGKAGGPGIDFDELGVSEVVELLDDANMEAVVRDFGDRNPEEDPVIHFYEDFVKEYDKSLWKGRGVIYTPRPVVSYIVRSVDDLLRRDFGLADGLADTTTWGEMAKRHKDLKIPEGVSPDEDFVQILDPATGTGTFLVEVIDVIHKTLVGRWKARGHGEQQIDVLWNEYVPRHLLTRVHGYELLMAPYAIAHLKIGLKLYETGYRFGSDERARVYLTNALEPASDRQLLLNFLPALASEAQTVNEVKRKRRFAVVIGNPPYNNRSENRTRWIMDLIQAYKGSVRREETQIQGLSDDYVKFLRLAEWNLGRTGAGALGIITNNGYLDGHIFRDMRRQLVSAASHLRVFNLHGDTRKKERAPDGTPDKNVFDIMQGVAVLTLAMGAKRESVADCSYGDVWGDRERKYRALAEGTADEGWLKVSPHGPLWMLVPSALTSAEWDCGYPLAMCFGTGNWQKDKTDAYGSGFKSQQDEFAIAFTREDLIANVETLLEPRMTEAELRKRFSLCNTSQWSFARARERLRNGEWRNSVQRVLFRPFDFRYTVIAQDIVTNPRREIMAHLEQPNLAILGTRKATEGFAAFVTRMPCGHKIVGNYDMTTVFPLYRYGGSAGGRLSFSGGRKLNLSPGFVGKLEDAGVLGARSVPESIAYYMYGLFHSPTYRDRHAEALKNDFPRVLLPGSPGLYGECARLGGELAALHLLESPKLATPTTEFLGAKNPEVEKVSWSDNTVWLDKAQTKGFRGVPEDVWNFHIGGYQVCEKWLKDRKGRTLSKDDIAHYQKVVGALAETIRLMKEIDEVIEQHGGWPGAFVTEPINAAEPAADRPGDLFSTADALAGAEGEKSDVKADDDDDGADETVSIDDIERAEVICQIRDLLTRPGQTDGVEREALLRQLSVELGFKRLGPRIRESLHGDLIAAARRGILETEGGRVRLVSRSVADLDREFLKEQFLASLEGTAWWEREVAIRDFARWFGFGRTGSVIDETARSLINGLIRTGDLESRGTEIRKAVR